MTPLYTCGLIADPQYGDLDNGNVEGRSQRYREVPGKLKLAVQALGANPLLRMVLVVGDFVNGRDGEEESRQDLEVVASIMDQGLGETPAFQVLGNHDLCLPRREWLARVKAPPIAYYSRQLAPGWRLVVLDTCDMCLKSGHAESAPVQQETQAYWAAHPLSEAEPHMVDWNGGVGSQQMSWLEGELAAAASAGDKVIVASHHPIGEGSARSTHMAWNWRQVQDVLVASGCVVLALAGHDHMGGYKQHGNVHFITLEAMLEAPEGSNAYGTLQLFPDHMLINGVGSVTSRRLQLAS